VAALRHTHTGKSPRPCPPGRRLPRPGGFPLHKCLRNQVPLRQWWRCRKAGSTGKRKIPSIATTECNCTCFQGEPRSFLVRVKVAYLPPNVWSDQLMVNHRQQTIAGYTHPRNETRTDAADLEMLKTAVGNRSAHFRWISFARAHSLASLPLRKWQSPVLT